MTETYSPASISLWIIEDSVDYREKLAMLFRLDGTIDCQQAAGSYEEAFELLETCEPPEIMLVDLNLPGTHGIQAIRELKRNYPTLLTIVLTVAGNRRSVFEALRAGSAGYLLKSEPFDSLVQHIHDVVDGGIPLSSSVTPFIVNALKAAPEGHRVSDLTEREFEILERLADGVSRKEAAAELSLATVTVDYHLQHIYQKLKVRSVAGAVGKAYRLGLLK